MKKSFTMKLLFTIGLAISIVVFLGLMFSQQNTVKRFDGYPMVTDPNRQGSNTDNSSNGHTDVFSPTTTPGSSPVVQHQELSTPELIEQAFIKGEITIEQRLLYLAYALGNYEKLPVQYRSNVPWDGTSILIQLEEAATSSQVICSLNPLVQSELQQLLLIESIECND